MFEEKSREYMAQKRRQATLGWVFVTLLLFSGTEASGANVQARLRSAIGASLTIPYRGCTIMTTKLVFSSDTFGRRATSDGSISVRCDSGVPYGITLGAGESPTLASRRMKNEKNEFLEYRLFQNQSRTIPWGDGSKMGPTKSSSGTGSNQVHRIYGAADFSQAQGTGKFSDQISITIYY
ncbi:MAG: spore coat U domain-containing protein [Nitrospinota bacterium]